MAGGRCGVHSTGGSIKQPFVFPQLHQQVNHLREGQAVRQRQLPFPVLPSETTTTTTTSDGVNTIRNMNNSSVRAHS